MHIYPDLYVEANAELPTASESGKYSAQSHGSLVLRGPVKSKTQVLFRYMPNLIRSNDLSQRST